MSSHCPKFSAPSNSHGVPDLPRRSYPPSSHKGRGGPIRNRSNRRSFTNGDSKRNSRSWSCPYSKHKDESTTYRQPKPLIISPSSDNAATKDDKVPSNLSTLPHLNPSSPTGARRINQRRRQILFGKNTAGYEAYIHQVPKEKRRRSSMEHPQTPDYTLDISVKRWQGLVNAWRRALHTFDPPDLATDSKPEGIRLAPRPYRTKQEEEVEQAKADGLQVAFGGMMVGRDGGFGVKVGESEVDVANEEDVLEEEEAFRTSCLWKEEEGGHPFLEEDVGYDSDDDVL